MEAAAGAGRETTEPSIHDPIHAVCRILMRMLTLPYRALVEIDCLTAGLTILDAGVA